MKNALEQQTPARPIGYLRGLRNVLCAGILAGTSCIAGAVGLADAPLFSTVVVPGNLTLAVSAEFPTALSPAYPSTSAYTTATSYIGYFDPEKCYRYIYNSATPADSYFTPVAAASSRACSSTVTVPLWSGNYLNWASMGALDTFRSVLTGGYRASDTTTSTILEKSYNFNSGAIQPANVVDKTITTAAKIGGATPFNWTTVTTKVWHQGTAMLITGSKTRTNDGTTCVSGSTCVNIGSPASPFYPIVPDGSTYRYYDAQNSSASPATAEADKVYKVYIRVKVCDTAVSVEPNCVIYGSNYKPEGLMQKYSSKLRFSAFGYLNIPAYGGTTGSANQLIDGGVLRAKMKFIGPTKPVPGSTAISNDNGIEWSASTGVMDPNPNATDAAATNTTFGISTVTNSGVMNYLNKFGSLTTKDYKTYDPVSELYYAALRYLKNQGNVPAYSAATTSASADGFPVITTWDDPILYSCQKNFILGIADVNAGADGNLPGSTLTSGEPSMPTEVSGDISVNVTTATTRVATLQGTASIATNKHNFIAGLAWDAHTKDIRTDLTGTQTVNTYWLDVWEYSAYTSKNQYWLAAKYGGFTVPTTFNPATDTFPTTAWYTTSDTVGSDPRPDNYFGAGQADTMKTGLESAFKKIASEASVATATAISSPTPRQLLTGNANYSVSYDPTTWTSTLLGQLVSYDNDGIPTYTTEWNATTLLNSRTSANRLVVTCCTSTGAALPFTYSSLTSATLDSRAYYTSFGAITGLSSGSQSESDYLGYLRGDRTHELSTSSGKYRARVHLLGDVVDSKLNVVGPPSYPYYDIYNPGYSDFKSTYISRPTVVYAGANDGMMHAFDGTVPSTAGGTCTSTLTTPSNACGKELFAYIPSFTYGNSSTAADSGLASLGTPNSYEHHYLVNATPVSSDVDFFKTVSPTASANDWRTLLVGGLGKGGKGYYAIDITNPADWTSETTVATKILWEFTQAHMGYSVGDAVFIKTPEFGWTIVVASGYNNDDGLGYFFFLNPRTGDLLKTVVTPTGSTSSPIDMAHIQAYVPNYQEHLADAIYAGDLQGNIWRVDLTPSTNATTVGSVTTTTTSYDYSIVNLATLTDSSGTAQPVTTKPLVEIDPASGKRYVLVGTGQLLSDNDITSTQKQAFYAINDGTKAYGEFYNGSINSTVGPTITTKSGIPPPSWDDDSDSNTPNISVTLPVTRSHLSSNTNLTTGISSSTTKPMGWYYDLGPTGSGVIAERVDVQPTATSDGIVGFAANLPNGDACSPAGTARVFAISFANGLSALLDSSGTTVQSISLTSNVTDVAFLSVGGKTRLYAGSGNGTITKIGTEFPGSTSYKRLNWREVPTAD